jgi:hypothetical protein
MHTNSNLTLNYVHKYKAYIKLCTQIQILHKTMYTNTNITLHYAHTSNITLCTQKQILHKTMYTNTNLT